MWVQLLFGSPKLLLELLGSEPGPWSLTTWAWQLPSIGPLQRQSNSKKKIIQCGNTGERTKKSSELLYPKCIFRILTWGLCSRNGCSQVSWGMVLLFSWLQSLQVGTTCKSLLGEMLPSGLAPGFSPFLILARDSWGIFYFEEPIVLTV